MPPPIRSEPSNPKMAALSWAITFHRKNKKLSLRKVAGRCELNYEHLTELARGHGNPTFDTLMEVCVGLDVTIGELMTSVSDFLSDRAKDLD
jgi:transcriptional regulator with XRE-family HTH domain